MYSARSTALVVVSCLLVPFASMFVALRFKVRKSAKAGLGLDDYTILAALVIQYAGSAMTIFGAVAGGEGDSEMSLLKNPSEMATYAKVQYMGPLIFAMTVALVKISTLVLYKRIFVTKRFHLACHMTMALTAGWFLTSIFGEIFSFNPISKSWDVADGPYVINCSVFLLSMGVINMVLDVLVVCMPLSVIQTLQMSSARKAQVSGIFLLGLFCIVAATVRFYYLQVVNNEAHGMSTAPTTNQLDALSEAIVTGVIWFYIEAHTSIIAACLPTLAPLFQNNQHVAFKIRTWRSMLSLHAIRPNGMIVSTKADSTYIEQGSKDDRRPWEHLRSEPSHDGDVAGDTNVELRAVSVV